MSATMKLVVARWKGQITAWWGPFRAEDADAERERIATTLRDDVVVAVEDAGTTRGVS
jgi:hypothetical protein